MRQTRHRPSSRRRTIRPRAFEVAWFAALIAVTVLGIRVLGARLDVQMAAVRDAAMAELSRQLGRHIDYGSISPSILRAIEVRNLVVRTSPGGAPLVAVDRVRVGYSLLRLVATGDPLEALREIRLVDSRFVIDTRRDRELIALLQRLLEAADPGALAVTLSGANLQVRVVADDAIVDVSRLFFRVRTGRELATSARADVVVSLLDAAGASAQTVADAPRRYETSVRIDGTTELATARSDANVDLRFVRGPSFQLGRQRLRIGQRGDEVRMVKVQDRAPVDLAASLALETGQLEVEFQVERFQPERMLRLRGSLSAAADVLSSSLTGEGTLRHQLGSSQFDYRFDLSGDIVGLPYPERVAMIARAIGDERSMALEPLQLDSDVGELAFVGDVLYENLFPDGLLTLRNVDTQTGHDLDAFLRLGRGLDSLRIRGDRIALGLTGFRNVQLDLRPVVTGGDAAGLLAAGFDYQLSAEVDDRGSNSIAASGSISLRPEVALEVDASVQAVPAGHIYDFFAPRGAAPWVARLADATTIGADLRVTTDFRRLQFVADRLYAFDAASPQTRVELAAAGSESEIDLHSFSGRYDDHVFSGSSTIRIEPRSVGVDAELVVDGLPYQLTARAGGGAVRVDGSHGLVIRGRRGLDGETLAFSVDSDQLPLPLVGAPPMLATLDMTGHFRSVDDWSLRSRGSTLVGVPGLRSERPTVEVTFSADQERATVSELLFEDDLSRLTGGGSGTYSTRLRDIEATLTLFAEEGGERYVAALSLTPEELNGRLSFAAAPLERLAALPISGDLNGTVVVDGEPELPAWSIDAELANGRLNRDPIALSGGVDIFDRLVSIRDVRLGLLSHRVRNGRVFYDLATGRLDAQADYAAEVFGDPVDASIQLTASDAAAPEGGGFADALALGATAELWVYDIRVDGEPLPTWQGRVAVPPAPTETAVTFAGGPNGAFNGRVDRDGSFELVAAEPYPIVGRASGVVAGRTIDARAVFDAIDVAFASDILDTDTLAFTAGAGSGEVTLVGPINDPDITGVIELTGTVGESRFSPATLGPYSTELRFGDQQLVIDTLRADGPTVAPLTLSAVAVVERWAPSDYRVELATTAEEGVPIRHRFGPVLYDGRAVGALSISGGGGEVAISGDVDASFATVSLAGQDEGRGGSPLAVDVAVRIGRRVEFAWPSEQFPILRALLDPEDQVAVRYDGADGSYAVEGEVAVRGGDVIYFDRSFILREGSIRFQEDELEFDPFLSVRAETRERDAAGTDVRITLAADTPLSEFGAQNISFTADPPTNELAIEALLGAPLTGPLAADQGSSGLGLTAISLSGDLLAQFGLIRPLESAVREALGLDLVSIRSPFVQNVLLDRVLSPIEGSTADLLDNTTLSLGKYIGSDLFLEALLRLQSPALGAGAPSGSGLESDLELSLEWATPFFLLEWSFIPQTQETLYVTDNSLSLRWRLTY